MASEAQVGRWRGIFPPLVTPLTGRDTLDEEGLDRLVEHVLAGGVHGLMLLGSTSEGPSLSRGLQEQIVRRVVARVNGRVPVLVTISDTAVVDTLNLAALAADAGADALVLAPPYYFAADQPELLEYLGHLEPELPLPLFLYNMPSLTKVSFEPDTVRRAADLEKIVGLKDSSGDMTYFHKLRHVLRDRPDFALFVGPEELLAESLLAGGHGGIAGGANLCPELYVQTYEAAVARDLDRLLALHERIIEISCSVYTVGRHRSSFLKGLKCALNLRGICSDFLAEPFHRFRTSEREELARRLRALDLLEE